jgi:hydrogenase maturation protein HypF
MPGGDKATEEPWRYALSLLVSSVGQEEAEVFAENNWTFIKDRATITNILKGLSKAPVSTSCGRLFDGVSALLSICVKSDYEGHAAMALEGAVRESDESALKFDLIKDDERFKAVISKLEKHAKSYEP